MPADGDYRLALIGEHCLHATVRRGAGRLLAATLDDGAEYLETACRTLVPFIRCVATAADGAVVGHAAGFRVPCQQPVEVRGLGDVAVDPRHRRRGIARRLCGLTTAACWRDGADIVVAKTAPLRAVLGDLGYDAIDDFALYIEDATTCTRHRDWMAARSRVLPRLRLLEGDF